MTLRELLRNWLMESPSSQTAQEASGSKDENTVSLVYKVTKEALAAQPAQLNSLETKASTLLAFAGGIFALLMGARETLIVLPRSSQFLMLVSIALFAVSVVLAFVVIWVRRYRGDPNPELLAEKYLESPLENIQLQLISNLIVAWKANHASIERNATYLRFAFLTQTIAFLLLGMALFVSFP